MQMLCLRTGYVFTFIVLQTQNWNSWLCTSVTFCQSGICTKQMTATYVPILSCTPQENLRLDPINWTNPHSPPTLFQQFACLPIFLCPCVVQPDQLTPNVGRKDSVFTHVIAINSHKPGWNMQTRLLSAVTMVTHERGTALSPPDSSLREGGKCHAKYKKGWKSALWTVAGEVLIGPEMLFSFDNIFLGEGFFNLNALLSLVVVPPQRWRPLQQDIYMERSHRVPRFFSASLLFLKWKWFCCAAYSLANGAQLQPLSRHWGWNIYWVLKRRKVTFWNLRRQDCVFVV